MAYQAKTLEEFEELAFSELRAKIPEADLSEGSDFWLLAKAFAAVAHGNQAQGKHVARQVTPLRAEGDFLIEHGDVVGLERLSATQATGKTIITAATDGHTQSSGSKLKSDDGSEYETTASATTATAGFTGKSVGPGSTTQRLIVAPTVSGMSVDDVVDVELAPGGQTETTAIAAVHSAVHAIDLYFPLSVIPASGSAVQAISGAVAPVTASAEGSAGNLDPRATLTLDSPVHSDVDAATITAEMSGGGDLETIEELRARILEFKRNTPGSSNVAHYRHWARTTPGVRIADAFVYAQVFGLGTIQVVPIGVKGARLTGTVVNSVIKAYLESQAGFACDVLVSSWGDAGAEPVDITITPGRGYEPDFDGTFTTDPFNSATEINLTSDPRGTIEVGDRVLVPVTLFGRNLLEQREVKAVHSSGIELVSALSNAPSNGETVRAGGPVAQPAIDAIGEVFDGLGPAAAGADNRHPDPVEKWPETLRVAALYRAVAELAGVLNVTINAPASDKTPASAFARLTQGQITIQWA